MGRVRPEEWTTVVNVRGRRIVFAYNLKQFFMWLGQARSQRGLRVLVEYNSFDERELEELLELIEMCNYSG